MRQILWLGGGWQINPALCGVLEVRLQGECYTQHHPNAYPPQYGLIAINKDSIHRAQPNPTNYSSNILVGHVAIQLNNVKISLSPIYELAGFHVFV